MAYGLLYDGISSDDRISNNRKIRDILIRIILKSVGLRIYQALPRNLFQVTMNKQIIPG